MACQYRRFGSPVVGILLPALLLLPQPIAPAVILVDETCSLADAITAANTDAPVGGCTAGSGADEIVLTGDVVLTTVDNAGTEGDNGLPRITSDVTIEGMGFTISRDGAAPAFRILEVETTGFLSVVDATLENGYAGYQSYAVPGKGGALLNAGTASLDRTILTNNTAGRTFGASGYGRGGAIYNTGALHIDSGTVSYNVANEYFGLSGGGIYNAGTATLMNSTISGNFSRGDYGFGGAISTTGYMAISNSTISENLVFGYAGAIWGSATLTNTSLVGNRAIPDAAYYGYALNGGTFTLDDTILTNTYGTFDRNCSSSSTIIDGAGNLADDDTCATVPDTLTGVDPTLADNGGPTLTHALLAGSTAIDAAGDCGVPRDQRGYLRSGDCDSGAFELGGQPPFSLSTTVCPGPTTISVSEATPSSNVGVLQGPTKGSSTVPLGPCTGTDLGITSPETLVLIATDATGAGSAIVDLVSDDCGQVLQAVDNADCRTSIVVKLDSCNPLTLSHIGGGRAPTADPPRSSGCDLFEYLPGESIELTAHPDLPDWTLGSWSGTDDDSSTSNVNMLTMPPNAHAVTATYIQGCFLLTLDRTGMGAVPTAAPASSPGCSAGRYVEGEVIDLTATPDPGWMVGGWRGTDDDASTTGTNQVTMPAGDHLAGVDYVEDTCHTLTRGHTGSGADPVALPQGDGSGWAGHLIDSGFNSARFVVAADVDGDGDQDAVGASEGLRDVVFYENDLGDGTAWTEHTVDDDFHAQGVFASDIDGDGDLDLLGAAEFDSTITWWENTTGDGTAWTEHPIDTAFSSAKSVAAADVDGDGDQDVLGAARSDLISWWENTAGDGSAWTEHSVSTNFNDTRSVRGADIDGDDDVDILGSAFEGDQIKWWENTAGDGTAWTERTVASSFDGANWADAADVDGDDDLDVVGTALFADDIAWWENTLGDGTAWARHTIDGSFDGAQFVSTVDMEGDGDLDVIGSAIIADQITWWENVAGDGSAWVETLVTDQVFNASTVSPADVDGDGDPDLVSSQFLGDSIDWWENLYTGICSPGDFRAGDRLGLTAVPDPGWEVGSWTGTDDDSSTETTNTATMPATDHTISVHYIQTPPPGPTLAISGICPGEVTLDITTPDPFEPVRIFAGRGPGTSIIPAGPCAGTTLDLDRARPWRNVTTDGNGMASIVSVLPANLCGRSVQAHDGSCAVSNRVEIP